MTKIRKKILNERANFLLRKKKEILKKMSDFRSKIIQKSHVLLSKEGLKKRRLGFQEDLYLLFIIIYK